MASRDINVVALVKGSERYVFLYDDDSRTEEEKTKRLELKQVKEDLWKLRSRERKIVTNDTVEKYKS